MEKEYQILTNIQEDENTSQRKLAQQTGLSLGTVNLLLKRMIRKGLIKTQRLNARSLRYILTPSGIAEKTQLTYNYIKYSCSHILSVTQAVDKIINDLPTVHGINPRINSIYLYGPQNEVFEILQFALSKANISFKHIANDEPIPQMDEPSFFIVWESCEEEQLSDGTYPYINIIKLL